MIKKTLIWIAASALLAASCGDDLEIDDKTHQSDNPTTPVEINDHNWPFDKWGDTSVSPGDDFFSYCVGKWYRDASDWRGITYESLVTIHEYFDQNYFLNNPLPSLVALTTDSARVDEPDVQQSAQAYTRQWVERVQESDSYEQLGGVMGELLKVGYTPQLATYVFNWQGKMVLMLMSPGLAEGDDDDNFQHMRRLDTRHTSQYKLREVTRADSDDPVDIILDAVAKSMDLKVGMSVFCFSDDEELDLILSQPLDTLKSQIVESIETLDAPFTSTRQMQESGAGSYEQCIYNLYQDYMNYEVAHYLYEKNFFDADHQSKLKTLCRDILTTLSARIDKLTWMSAATKMHAKRKVQTMKFFIGYPDTWYEEGLPNLDGRSMVEDVHQLLAADFKISRYVIGKEIGVAVSYLCPQLNNIATDNAFYHPAYNTFFVYPNYMFEPYFIDDVLDAHLYGAVGSTIGHEIVHGFDDRGASYDYQGNYAVSDSEPFGWWQENDYYEYVRRQRLLIDSYNNIPFEPWVVPGMMNDGEKCLGENIADVGGMETALECYTSHVKKQGFGEEAIKDLQRLFFKAYAYGWRTKYPRTTIDYLIENDVHSSYFGRVIGATRNCDAWYNLFNVTQEQKYYLPASQRCHVW